LLLNKLLVHEHRNYANFSPSLLLHQQHTAIDSTEKKAIILHPMWEKFHTPEAKAKARARAREKRRNRDLRDKRRALVCVCVCM
jgi:23S rRNA maturation mini-RNase III